MRVAGAIEGETLEVRAITGGKHEVQGLDGFGEGRWSNDSQLWWTGGKPGDQLTLQVPVAAAGTYRLKAVFTKAPDYGIVQARLGAQKLGEPIDLYAPQVEPSALLDLGPVTLSAGAALLTLEITGRNPASKPGHMVGLDYLLLAR